MIFAKLFTLSDFYFSIETIAVMQVHNPHHSLTHCRTRPHLFSCFFNLDTVISFILIKLSLFISNFIRKKKWKEKRGLFYLYLAHCVSCLRMICSCVSKVVVMLRLMMVFCLSRSQSCQTLFFFVFWFLLLSSSVCNKWKKWIYYKMAKLNSKKWKNSLLAKKKVS